MLQSRFHPLQNAEKIVRDLYVSLEFLNKLLPDVSRPWILRVDGAGQRAQKNGDIFFVAMRSVDAQPQFRPIGVQLVRLGVGAQFGNQTLRYPVCASLVDLHQGRRSARGDREPPEACHSRRRRGRARQWHWVDPKSTRESPEEKTHP